MLYLRYELSCENDHTVLYLYAGKYYVQEIDYNNSTIWVLDSGIQKDNYFSTPSYSLYPYNFSFPRTALSYDLSNYNSRIVVFMSCEKPVNTPFYLDTSTCKENREYSHYKRYKYVTIGTISATEVEDIAARKWSSKYFLYRSPQWIGIWSWAFMDSSYLWQLLWKREFLLPQWLEPCWMRQQDKSEKGHNTFHSLIKYLTCWPLFSSCTFLSFFLSALVLHFSRH